MAVHDSAIRHLLHGRTVLVTGADGFVGSHLTETLLAYGADVHVMIRPSSSGMLHNIVQLRKLITVHHADLTDKESVRQTLAELKKAGSSRPIIMHLGAQAHVGESWRRAYETINSNVIGTLNLLQTIQDVKLAPYKISFAGSSEEYGNVNPETKDQYRFDRSGGLILDEKSPVNPQSIYAVSKLAGDFLCRNYFKAYGLPCVVARKFNNYGPRQNPRFVTATIITQALVREEIKLGYLGSRRDFTYVRDGAMGHIHVALFGHPGDVYCFGSGKTIKIADWLDLILTIGRELGYWREKRVIYEKKRGRLGKSEVDELRVDYAKLNRLTGWKPAYSREKGLKETIRWYAENKASWLGRVDW
ncbi:GDP-mannose 4,6-dehydratase [Patescibacteria group bacterium]|nr:GDP-mannose 4,6-dehydratase [Patescibacteria group bacterium]